MDALIVASTVATQIRPRVAGVDGEATATPPVTEQAAACPLCHSVGGQLLFRAQDRYYRLPGEFGHMRCRACGFVWLSPRPAPASLSYYYPEDEYYSYRAPEGLSDRGRLTRVREQIRATVFHSMGYPVHGMSGWQRALQPLLVKLFRKQALYGLPQHFPRYRAGGRALDIGCGNGQYLSHLKRHGWQVVGVELSRTAAAIAQREHDIDVFVGSVREAPFAPASFDFVHMSHVLEHFYDPLEQLQAVVRLLKPGGQLYIETPNADSLGLRQCGPYWYPWETPRHLCLFAPKTLTHSLTTVGLEVRQLWTYLFKGLYSWEDTYRREEAAQKLLTPRPQMRWQARPRAAALGTAARLDQLLHRLRGDILCCWAAKP